MCLVGKQVMHTIVEQAPIRGVRVFWYDGAHLGPRLYPIYWISGVDNYLTPTIATATAECLTAKIGLKAKHPAPDLACECGLYAYHTLNDLKADDNMKGYYERWREPKMGSGGFSLASEVHGWGKVIVANNGWRAKRLRIITLGDEEVAKKFGVGYNAIG